MAWVILIYINIYEKFWFLYERTVGFGFGNSFLCLYTNSHSVAAGFGMEWSGERACIFLISKKRFIKYQENYNCGNPREVNNPLK